MPWFAISHSRAKQTALLIGSLDDKQRLAFLTQLAKKVNKPSSQDAYVYALVAASDVKLLLRDYSGARKDLNVAESILDTFDSVETEVHASFYRTNASYYQVRSSDFPLSRTYLLSLLFLPLTKFVRAA